MTVDSYLELYTTLFGWDWYNTFWFMITDTGLILLPFIGIVLDHYITYRKGFEDGDAEELTLRGLEVELILAIFVVMLAGSPMVPLDAEELVYTPPALVPAVIADPEAEEEPVTPGDSNTTFGETGFNNYPDSVKVPPLYYAINRLSAGFNHGAMEVAPAGKDLRYYTERLRLASIEDPELRQEANDFFRDCFAPARSKYLRDEPNSPAINALLETYGEDDPHWMGSHVYLNVSGYYNTLRAAEITPPFLYSALRDTEWDITDPNKPTHGKPYCTEWWASGEIGLKARLIETMGTLDSVAAWVEEGWNETLRHDALVKNLFANGPPQWTPRGYDYAYTNGTGSDDDSNVQRISLIRKVMGTAAAGLETAKAEINMTVFLNASPAIQSLLLMFLYAFTPFVLFLSRFSITGALTVGLAMFAVKFLTVIWFMVWWVDQNLMQAMYPNVGDITKLSQIDTDLEGMDKRMLLNYLTKMCYYVAPLIFLTILSWGGYRMIGGIANMKNALTGSLKTAGNAPVGAVAGAATRRLGK